MNSTPQPTEPIAWGPRQLLWGEIKQIQLLMLLLANLPRDGKVAEVLRMALETPADQARAHLEPCPEVSTNGIRTWLSTIWSGDQTPAMRNLIAWQLEKENMAGAIPELVEAQQALGFVFSIVRKD